MASWVGALATFGAFLAAFIQIRQERTERKKREVHEKMLSDREQALKVSAWAEGGKVFVANSSEHPVHEVKVVLKKGEIFEQTIVPPGRMEVGSVSGRDAVVLVEFTDNKLGIRWRREPGKQLKEV